MCDSSHLPCLECALVHRKELCGERCPVSHASPILTCPLLHLSHLSSCPPSYLVTYPSAHMPPYLTYGGSISHPNTGRVPQTQPGMGGKPRYRHPQHLLVSDREDSRRALCEGAGHSGVGGQVTGICGVMVHVPQDYKAPASCCYFSHWQELPRSSG